MIRIDSRSQIHSQMARRGSGLVLAMVVLLGVAAMMYMSTDNVAAVFKQLDNEGIEQRVKAAAEAVAASKEEDLVDLTASADHLAITGLDATYGVQWFGGCEVKWRIEPFLAYDTSPDSSPGIGPTKAKFIVNYDP